MSFKMLLPNKYQVTTCLQLILAIFIPTYNYAIPTKSSEIIELINRIFTINAYNKWEAFILDTGSNIIEICGSR